MTKKLAPAVIAYLREQGTKGGKIGGKRSLETMTAAARRERAQRAGEASGVARKRKAKAKKPD